MESNRISLAACRTLGVRVTWREAAAIVHEAMALTRPATGARPDRVLPESCVLTRGGEVVLVDDAAQARPETTPRLLEPLLTACDARGGLGSAFENGVATSFLQELALRVTAKRRRAEIAGVAIRGWAPRPSSNGLSPIGGSASPTAGPARTPRPTCRLKSDRPAPRPDSAA